MTDKIFFDPTVNSPKASVGLFPSQAIVTDVITNEEHPEYDEAGYNVGTIKFKYVDYGAHPDLNYTAQPMDITIQEYPLINEVVLVQTIRGRRFYNRRLNINKDLIFNSYYAAFQELSPPQNTIQRSENIQRARQGGLHTPEESITEEQLNNENFEPPSQLNSLKHFDGDVIFQNRYGASLRFGSSQIENALNKKTKKTGNKTILGPTNSNNNSPIIILRAGQNDNPQLTTNSPYALTVEDINADLSSLVLSTNQQINFSYATGNSDSHFRSFKDLNRSYIPNNESTGLTPLPGAQAILNSGRVVINAKQNDVILSSNNNTIFLSNSDIVADAGRDNIISSGRDVLIRPDEGYIVLGTLDSGRGSRFVSDPLSQSHGPDTYLSVAIAEPIIEILDRLITLLTPSAAPGIAIASPGQPIIPLWNPKMKVLSRELSKIRSNLVRIQK